MQAFCTEHQNKVSRICLAQQCEGRAMCLLCDHQHGSPFQSIMVKKSQNYRTFAERIDQAIDQHLLIQSQSDQARVLLQQEKMIREYFKVLGAELNRFLQEMQSKALEGLQGSQQEAFEAIKTARIRQDYLALGPESFKVLLEVYEGTELKDIFKEQASGNVEQNYHRLLSLHQDFGALMVKNEAPLRARLPDIRRVSLREQDHSEPIEHNSYETAQPQVRKKYKVSQVSQSTAQIDSVVSHCIRSGDSLITTAYDKTLRVFDSHLQLKGEKEFSNILTKIHKIADDIFAIGCSKEVVIEKIGKEKKEWVFEGVMKLRGHKQRITDIHCLNSRIVGSTSSEGVKLWDLYKEKCEYTLKGESAPTAIRFLPASNLLALGLDDHRLALHSLDNMKVVRHYPTPGVPLVLDCGKFADHIFYAGGFPGSLMVVDSRLSKPVYDYSVGKDAVTCVGDSPSDERVVGVGDRGGGVSLLDLRSRKVRIHWEAHVPKTTLSKPRGVVGVFEDEPDMWITAGCNDSCLRKWDLGEAGNH